MTFRLVGLMSLVLLLSLAAFALLMSSYQAGVMDEVTRTVSAVGRATLQTFELRTDALDVGPATAPTEGEGPADGEASRHDQFTYRIVTTTHGEKSQGALTGEAAGSRGGWVEATSRAEPGEAAGVAAEKAHGAEPRQAPDETEEELSGERMEEAPGGEAIKALHRQMLETPGHGIAVVHVGTARVLRSTATEVPTEKGRQVLIRIEEVRAESDPTHGTVLRIPTWTVEDGKAPEPGNGAGGEKVMAPSMPGGDRTVVVRTGDPVTDLSLPSGRQDLLVNVPTHDFQNLFTAFRRRTLFLFLGIFLVGTVLSAGLAAHFTRPVRRLDAGIRRLAEGDLEVEVPDGGRDEIGRLARTFNEMARRLRAGRDRERELRRREKLSALGRLAAGVAHDVRNPLHSINLTLQNLEETARPGEAARTREFDRSVGIIREEIRRLDRLVENFLRFARSDRTTRVPVDLTLLARETALLVEKEAERRRVRVEVVTDGEPGIVQGNMESIRSSVLNLVLNSFEAMPEGGTLTLTAGAAGGEARLEVADTGRGIPAEEQEKVFEFAYTTREDGHGMGLAMVHQVVVEEHGGRVLLASRPGEGTRVLLAFPVDTATGSTTFGSEAAGTAAEGDPEETSREVPA